MTRKDLELIAAFQVGLDVALFDEWPMPPEHWSKSRREAYEAGYTHGKIRIRELFLDEEVDRVAS